MTPFSDLTLWIAVLTVAVVLMALLRWLKRRRSNWIVVDGSNVLHWEDDRPDLGNVVHVIRALKSEGYDPVVWFDANVGYRIGNRYMGPRPLAKALGLPQKYVFVAPKGTPADPLLLKGARVLKARVVTNDKFRDWVEEFPEIKQPGFLVPGRMTKDEFELGWDV